MHEGLRMVKTGTYTAVESDIYDDVDSNYQSCPATDDRRTRIQSGVLARKNYCSQNEEYDDNHNRNKQNKNKRKKKKKKDTIIQTPQPTRRSKRLSNKNITLKTPTSLSPRSERVMHVEDLTYDKKIDYVNVC